MVKASVETRLNNKFMRLGSGVQFAIHPALYNEMLREKVVHKAIARITSVAPSSLAESDDKLKLLS